MSEPARIAIAVVEWRDAFLVGRRGDDVALAGMHEFPGGKVEPEESVEAAAQRECLEETGLRVAVVKKHLVETHSYDHGAVELHFFACQLLDPPPPDSDAFEWVPRAALADCDFPAGNRRLLELLLDG